jgi:hypothetical protein
MITDRFWEKVDKTDGCWLWTGGVQSAGYGMARGTTAHRVAYTLAVGPIPEGHHLHHECQVRLCVNPAHLRPITQCEHNKHHHPKDHCPKHGPEHADDYVITSQGGHRCRICHRERQKMYDLRKRAA